MKLLIYFLRFTANLSCGPLGSALYLGVLVLAMIMPSSECIYFRSIYFISTTSYVYFRVCFSITSHPPASRHIDKESKYNVGRCAACTPRVWLCGSRIWYDIIECEMRTTMIDDKLDACPAFLLLYRWLPGT